MLDPESLGWRDELVLSHDVVVAGDRREFYNRVRRGELTFVRRGVYVPTEVWRQHNADGQYRLRVVGAVAQARTQLIPSHMSAAALWRLPWFGPWPRAVHVLDGHAPGGRSSGLTVRHSAVLRGDPEWIEGIPVTALARTVVDIATTTTFEQAVVVADAALRRTTHPVQGVPATSLDRQQLRGELQEVAVRHGSARASRVIEFADGLADRPGESLSRVNIARAGLSAAVLQAPLRGASGRLWHCDFWWPLFNMIGEFDGETKYSDPLFLAGRTPAEALRDEKYREDDLRAAHFGMSRWVWSTATSMPLLRAHLIAAGVR